MESQTWACFTQRRCLPALLAEETEQVEISNRRPDTGQWERDSNFTGTEALQICYKDYSIPQILSDLHRVCLALVPTLPPWQWDSVCLALGELESSGWVWPYEVFKEDVSLSRPVSGSLPAGHLLRFSFWDIWLHCWVLPGSVQCQAGISDLLWNHWHR